MVLLLPKDPLDEKNIMLEIRAGTGGDEASLWAGDLLRMYQRYCSYCTCPLMLYSKRFRIRVQAEFECRLSGSS